MNSLAIRSSAVRFALLALLIAAPISLLIAQQASADVVCWQVVADAYGNVPSLPLPEPSPALDPMNSGLATTSSPTQTSAVYAALSAVESAESDDAVRSAQQFNSILDTNYSSVANTLSGSFSSSDAVDALATQPSDNANALEIMSTSADKFELGKALSQKQRAVGNLLRLAANFWQ